MNQESNVPQTPPDHQLEKRQTLWILLALFFAAGWFSAIISEKSSYFLLYQLIVSLSVAIFIVRWVVLDSIQYRFKVTHIWIFCFVLFSFLPVPFYLFQTRGKAAWRPILAELGLLFVYSIAMGVGKSIATALGL